MDPDQFPTSPHPTHPFFVPTDYNHYSHVYSVQLKSRHPRLPLLEPSGTLSRVTDNSILPNFPVTNRFFSTPNVIIFFFFFPAPRQSRQTFLENEGNIFFSQER